MTRTQRDHYAVLEAAPNATRDELKQAFRRRSLECHPDRGGSHKEMLHVIAAWEILSNPETRAHYDAARKHPEDAQVQQAVKCDEQAAATHAHSYPQDWTEFERWQKREFDELLSKQNVTPKLLFQLVPIIIVITLLRGPIRGVLLNILPGAEDSLLLVILECGAIAVVIAIGFPLTTMIYSRIAGPCLRKDPIEPLSGKNQPDSLKRKGWSVGLSATIVGLSAMMASGAILLSKYASIHYLAMIFMPIGVCLLILGVTGYLTERSSGYKNGEAAFSQSRERIQSRQLWTWVWILITLIVLGFFARSVLQNIQSL